MCILLLVCESQPRHSRAVSSTNASPSFLIFIWSPSPIARETTLFGKQRYEKVRFPIPKINNPWSDPVYVAANTEKKGVCVRVSLGEGSCRSYITYVHKHVPSRPLRSLVKSRTFSLSLTQPTRPLGNLPPAIIPGPGNWFQVMQVASVSGFNQVGFCFAKSKKKGWGSCCFSNESGRM